ncbi:MAG: fused MFS/spermidine synthase [Planctomycetes bacterium]|nr:fused MFS/spermidine synthase [Planctomycetota bacterium]
MGKLHGSSQRRQLLAIFFCSGFAGLLYEVVWMRMLVRAFGCTNYATSNTLAVFMLGLAVGGWVGGRWAGRERSPLLAYALVEGGLAVAGLAASWGASHLWEVFAVLAPAGPPHSVPVVAVRSALAFAVLGLPTFLMGVTLPLLAEHHARERRGGMAGDAGREDSDSTALLYGVNTLGAVAGVLFSGFVALGAWGEGRTVSCAVGMNFGVALMALSLARRERGAQPAAASVPQPAASGESGESGESARRATRFMVLMACSGFGALALEVLWTRMLVLLVGTSVYGFSAMLAAYLTGLGVGSVLCGRWLRRPRPLVASFAVLQATAALLTLASLETYYRLGLAKSDPRYLYSPLHEAWDFVALFFSSGAVVLPVTLVYGALFPLAIRIADETGSGRSVGRLYTWNTLGSVAGSLCGGLVLIPLLGTRWGVLSVAGIHAMLALVSASAEGGRTRAAWALATATAAAGVAVSLHADPFLGILTGRLAADARVLRHLEGASATVTITERNRTPALYINGVLVNAKAMMGRFMAHAPLLLQAGPKRALVICLGAGNTFRAAVDHGVEVDLVELEPDVVASFPLFWPDSERYLRHPKARVFVDDGRHFLLTSRMAYDLIVVDGSPPIFAAGTVNLYTRQFVALAHEHLTESGVLALWVPIPCFRDDLRRIARNFVDAFPSTAAWWTRKSPGILLLGSGQALAPEPGLMLRRMQERGLAATDPYLPTALADVANYDLDATLRGLASGVEPVTDDRPYTEFPLPKFLRGEAMPRTKLEVLDEK